MHPPPEDLFLHNWPYFSTQKRRAGVRQEARGGLRLGNFWGLKFLFFCTGTWDNVPAHSRQYISFLSFTVFLAGENLLNAGDQSLCSQLFPAHGSSAVHCCQRRKWSWSSLTCPSCTHADLQCTLPFQSANKGFLIKNCKRIESYP